jgi:hypothetical protein
MNCLLRPEEEFAIGTLRDTMLGFASTANQGLPLSHMCDVACGLVPSHTSIHTASAPRQPKLAGTRKHRPFTLRLTSFAQGESYKIFHTTEE